MEIFFKTVILALFAFFISSQHVFAEDIAFSPGLLYPDGIEPGDPSECEAPNGNRCWWMDADAADGGDGSYENPANNFEVIRELILGGDYLYLKGHFDSSNRLIFRQSKMGGHSLDDNPTVVKTYKGEQRAILDGEYTTTMIIEVANNSGIRFQNIEIINADGTGMHSGEGGVNVELVSVVFRDNRADGYIGVGGAVLFAFWNNSNQVIVRNCLFYNNKVNPRGVLANLGSLSILAESGAGEDAKIEIYNNIFHDEFIAIRHKHSGDVEMDAHHNLIYNCSIAVFMRSWENYVHHNVIYNISEHAFEVLQENQNGDISVEAFNNTIVNAERLIRTNNAGLMNGDYDVFLNLHDNIFSNPSGGEQTIHLGGSTWDPNTYPVENSFDISHWTSSNNLFNFNENEQDQFIFHNGEIHEFIDTLDYLNGDTSSFKAEPGFVDPDNHDFSLSTGSLAIGNASNGGDIGALPFSSIEFLPGDIDNSGSVDLIDTILSLQIVSGSQYQLSLTPETDIGENDKVGLEEAIFTLRHLGGLAN